MAWGRAGRPTWKYCRGYDRGPHRMRYDTDFPRVRRKLKNGRIADYAGPLCYGCRRAYERDLRRMNNRLEGRANRPQDVPWKKYRSGRKQDWFVGIWARQFQRPSEPFMEWFDEYLKLHKMTREEVCAKAGVSSRTVRRWREQGYLHLPTAQKFFEWADMPHMVHVLYPMQRERTAA